MITTEKAIQLLHRLQDEQFDGIHGDERREALEMAVRALSSHQTDTDSQGLVNDCISRKMAIDAINNCYCGGEDSCGEPWIYEDDAIKAVEQLPSAQPQACYDAISRDDAIMAVKTGALSAATIFGRTDEGATAYYETVKAIKALPSAQPERKMGKWITYRYLRENWSECECDQCHKYVKVAYDYCPNCGARMVKEGEEHD